MRTKKLMVKALNFVEAFCCLLAIIIAISPWIVEKSHLDPLALVFGDNLSNNSSRFIKLGNGYGVDKMKLVFNEEGSSTYFQAELWRGGKIVGVVDGSYPGYFGFYDVDDDGRYELLSWGFQHRNSMEVFSLGEFVSSKKVNSKATLIFILGRMIFRYGFFCFVSLLVLSLIFRYIKTSVINSVRKTGVNI